MLSLKEQDPKWMRLSLEGHADTALDFMTSWKTVLLPQETLFFYLNLRSWSHTFNAAHKVSSSRPILILFLSSQPRGLSGES